tara:strand:- start:32 stop:550 length:519 start_codon:yes stop_codon:yes gene_type:complete
MECPICFYSYLDKFGRKPLCLPCGHGVCEQCANFLKQDSFGCPICRSPLSSEANLAVNYPLLELATAAPPNDAERDVPEVVAQSNIFISGEEEVEKRAPKQLVQRVTFSITDDREDEPAVKKVEMDMDIRTPLMAAVKMAIKKQSIPDTEDQFVKVNVHILRQILSLCRCKF